MDSLSRGRPERFGLPDDYRKQQSAILQAFTSEQSQKLARRWMKADDMIILVVGDAERIRPELEQLGLPIVELNASAGSLTEE